MIQSPAGQAAIKSPNNQQEESVGGGSSASLPLMLKWSLSISALIVLVMGSLGWYLLDQQRISHNRQSQQLGKMLVEQLAHAVSEPLMADDRFALQLLLRQQGQSPLIVGAQVYNIDGTEMASAGEARFQPDSNRRADPVLLKSVQQRPIGWSRGTIQARSFTAPVMFRQVQAGFALVSIDQASVQRDLQRLTRALLATSSGLVLIGVLLAIYLAHRLCRPIYRLVEAGEALEKGDETLLLEPDRGDEIGRVINSFRVLSENMEQKRQAERLFNKYVSPPIASKLLQDPDSGVAGATLEGSVLFCDIVGFTEIAERLRPEQVADLLNRYFRFFALAAESCHGTVDKFIGDCVMVLFGVPEADQHHRLHAITCAVLFQEITRRLNRELHREGQEMVCFRIGVNSGTMHAGSIGSESRMQYTVVGDVVNVASRLCSVAAPGAILANEDTVLGQPGFADGLFHAREPLQVKGRNAKVIPYAVDAEGFSLRQAMNFTLEELFAEQGGEA